MVKKNLLSSLYVARYYLGSACDSPQCPFVGWCAASLEVANLTNMLNSAKGSKCVLNVAFLLGPHPMDERRAWWVAPLARARVVPGPPAEPSGNGGPGAPEPDKPPGGWRGCGSSTARPASAGRAAGAGAWAGASPHGAWGEEAARRDAEAAAAEGEPRARAPEAAAWDRGPAGTAAPFYAPPVRPLSRGWERSVALVLRGTTGCALFWAAVFNCGCVADCCSSAGGSGHSGGKAKPCLWNKPSGQCQAHHTACSISELLHNIGCVGKHICKASSAPYKWFLGELDLHLGPLASALYVLHRQQSWLRVIAGQCGRHYLRMPQ